MAHVEKRGPGRWRARYRAPDGREKSKTFPTRRDAERWLADVEHSKNVGGWVDPAGGRRLFRDYAEAWASAQVYRPTTAERFDVNLRRHILPAFGDRPLASIRPSEVQAWVRTLADKLAPATVEVAYRQLGAVFRSAVADGLLASSPCRGVKLPRKPRERVVPLETDQVVALVAAAPDVLRGLIIVAAGSGLRQGEMFGLEVGAVDFLRRTIRVERQLVTVNGKAPFPAPPKSEASRRTVPVPAFVTEALSEHLRAFPTDGGLVFRNAAGEPWRRNRFGEVWRRVVASAGLPAGTGFHALRHYYASLLIRHGESVKAVQERLGHASATETLNVYSHLWPDSDDRTREAVDAVLGDALAGGSRPARGLGAL